MVRAAVALATGDRPVIVLQHVIDPSLGKLVAAQGYADEASAHSRLRGHAEAELALLAKAVGDDVDVQTIVSEGSPFYEILRVAHDLAVDAVVISKKGVGRDPEAVFFGSTAERVVRGCNRPVIVLPPTA
jgi:nucleotide-binding universal stress UspA family protein